MNYETITIDTFSMIGISIRTTNQNGQSQKDVAELWDKFMKQNLIAQIPNKVNNDIYCLYTDYESDFMGAYTTFLGCKVTSLDTVPESLIGKEIPKTTCNHYKAVGALPYCVGEIWGEIWQSNIDRKYIADFDVYGEKAQNPQEAEVFVSISDKAG
jgi:Uncharacterized protein conserved in bacteria